MSNKKNTISLCMIVKNEEEFLGQCLESVKDVVDEMIIVDTGSTDRTVDISKSYGAQVYFHEWEGSFSKARNLSLSYATCDWILQLDADEALEPADVPVMRKLLERNEYNAIFVALLNENSEGWAKHYFQRIFRRGKAHFEGIVHNQLVYEGAHVVSEIRVYHYGYNLSPEKMVKKYERTANLLLKQIEERPNNAFAWRNYLRVLRSQKKFQEVIEKGKKAFELCKSTMEGANLQLSVYDMAYALTQLNRHQEAEELTGDYLAQYPDNLDLWFTRGISQMGQKHFHDAIKTFGHFISLKLNDIKIHPQIICDTFTMQHKAYAMISDAYMELKDYPNAEAAAKKAVEEDGNTPIYHLSYARALAALGRDVEANQVINSAAENFAPEEHFYLKWSHNAKMFPALGNPLDILRTAVRKFPQSIDLNNHFAFAVYQHNTDEAMEHWQTVISLAPYHIGAYTGMAKYFFSNGDFESLVTIAEKIRSISTKTPVLKELAHFCALAKKYETAIELLNDYIMQNPVDVFALSKLSLYYAENGQFDAALVGLKQVLASKPKDETIIANLRKIQQLIQQEQVVQ